MSSLKTLIIAASILSFSTIAHARRNQREGFNFGLGVRAISSTDNTNGTEGNSNSKKDTSSQAFTPHVGFVFLDMINFGLAGYFENESTDETFKSQDGSQQIDRSSKSSMKGGSLYTRFMFANYMHFEAGAGIYSRNIKITDEYTHEGENGSFTGERTEYSAKGIGAGYHAGAGVEVPVVQGFFVSSDFIIRSIDLRDSQSGGVIGKKRTRLDKRELTFGISHYID